MENQRNPIIPNHYFAYASSECQKVFNYECYFACIALCQSVAEAIARFMYETWTKNKSEEDKFFTHIKNMRKFKVEPDVTKLLIHIYGGQQRHDFHHLNPTVPTSYEQLRKLATEKINLLNKVESQVFEYEYSPKGLKYKYPKYWEGTDKDENVYLRFDV